MKNKKWTFRLLTLMLSMAFIFSVVGVNTFLTISADGPSTVSIGGLTLTANDGSALVDGTDYQTVTETYATFNSSGAAANQSITMITIKTSQPITVSGSSSTHGIRIAAGVHADLTLNGVTITAPFPMDIQTNINGTAAGTAATRGNQILEANRTSLYLTLADGSENTLSAPKNNAYSFPAIHCGEGSVLVIDDALRNATASGEAIEPDHGRMPSDCTLANGKEVKKGAPSWEMDSANPGKLTANGGHWCSAIGSFFNEDSGKMTFNGGVIVANACGTGNAAVNAGAAIGGGKAGGVGCKEEGGGITINGGQITAQASYHGAGIGAGWYNATGTTLATNTIRAKNSGTAYQPVPGDITVNGGYTVSYGAEHGNALGGACGSGNNVGHGGSSTPHEIVINGGTLIPKSTAATSTYDVGATGANVIVTGGSFPLQKNSTGSVDGLSIKGAGVYSADGSSLTMVKIDVSAMEGIEVGYKINSFDVLVDNKPLEVPYGLADRVDSEKTLYFWLPSSAKGKSVTIENVTLRDDEGKIIKAGYPFSLPEVGGKDDVTKRWVIFKVDTEKFSEELNKLLYKRYDGLGWDYGILSNEIVAQNIEIPELPGAFITKAEELAYSAVRTTDWSGNPTTDESSSGQISTTGTYRITVNYNEFINDPKVSNSFWGHQTTLESIISPADSRITNLKGTSDYQEGTTEDGKKKYKTLTLTADVLPAE